MGEYKREIEYWMGTSEACGPMSIVVGWVTYPYIPMMDLVN